jgi:hypothetical protein
MSFSRASVSPLLRLVVCSAVSLVAATRFSAQRACTSTLDTVLPRIIDTSSAAAAGSASQVFLDCSLARRLFFPYAVDSQLFSVVFGACFVMACFLAFAPRSVLRGFVRAGEVEVVKHHSAAAPRDKFAGAVVELAQEDDESESEAEAEVAEIKVAAAVVPTVASIQVVPTVEIAKVVEAQVVTPRVETVRVAEAVQTAAALKVAAPKIEAVVVAQVAAPAAAVVAVVPVVEQVRVAPAPAAPSKPLSFAEMAARKSTAAAAAPVVASKSSAIAPPPGLGRPAAAATVAAAPLLPAASATAAAAPRVSHSVLRTGLAVVKAATALAHTRAATVAGATTYARGPDGTKGFAFKRTDAWCMA